MKQSLIITPSAKIPLHSNTQLFIFNPLQRQTIRFPIYALDGEYHIPSFNIEPGLKIEESIITVENNQATICVINYTDTIKKIDITKNFNKKINKVLRIDELYHYDEQHIWRNSKNYYNLLYENIKNNLNVENLNIEEKAAIKALAIKYKHIFHVEGQPLSFTHCIKHKLNMKDSSPIYVRMYRQPIEIKKEIKTQVENLLEQDIIQDSISPWSCPVNVVIRTTNGKETNGNRL